MVSIFSSYPCGTVLLRTKAIYLKYMHRLITLVLTICQVNNKFHSQLYKNLKFFSLWQNTTCKTHVLQHCQHDRIHSRVQIHACYTKLSSQWATAVIFLVISVLPFSAKNVFVTASLLESSLAQLKNVVSCFQTISCLLSFKEGNEWISSAACLFKNKGIMLQTL